MLVKNAGVVRHNEKNDGIINFQQRYIDYNFPDNSGSNTVFGW